MNDVFAIFDNDKKKKKLKVDLQRNVSATGRKCVSISDPHIAVDNNYSVYLGAKDKYFVKWANGSNYEADCWPGLSSWIDFMIPEASDYYSSWFAFDKFNGSTETLAGIWNDMNEPAVFDDTIEKTLPFEVLHAGGVKHGDIHNIYGFMQTRATHKGLMDRDQQKKRPFILSRSTFAGSQRYAAMWTGDNSATWNHFANTYPECMTANLMGMVFCGADIGGFLGDPSDELLQRWYQGAVWTTFFRGHSSRESQRREPFLFSEEVQNVIRNAIRLRYQHIPVFYRLFFEHTRTGDPILRPLFYQYTDINERDTQMLIGTDIMSVAVTKPNITSVNVFIPGESEYWYRVDEGWSVHAGGKEVNAEINIATSPYYYRAGSIIVRQDTIVKSTTEALNASYSIYVNLDLNNQAEGRFYMDDFISFDYTNKNEYIYFSMRAINHKLIITPIDGNHGDLVAHLKEVIVHRIVTENDGKLGSSETTYIKTADGTPLESIDIGKELLTGEGLTIHL
nr:neutral alpha-glucosidase C-like [Leptinotarsa decemlineata]